MKIAVIGAGIAGLIAADAFQREGHNVTVFEASRKENYKIIHDAVFRLRNKSAGEYLNCNIEKIRVQKGIWYDGKSYTTPTIRFNNLYSMKAYGMLDYRSLESLGDVKRYMISDIETDHLNIVWGSKADKDNIHNIVSRKYSSSSNNEIAISTIPMPYVLKIFDIGLKNLKLDGRTIHISKIRLKIDSRVHQTIYFPSNMDTFAYRATLDGNIITAEGMKHFDSTKEILPIIKAFGIDIGDINSISTSSQRFGKIVPIGDYVRRKIIVDLTNKHKVYSFGRYAVWKSLRVDDLFDDIKKLKRIVSLGNEGYYEDI